MTDQKLDELMKQTLWDSIRFDDDIMFRMELQFVPSLTYETQIRRMKTDPNGWMRKRVTPMWKTILQKVATILIVLSVTLGSMMVFSTEVRATVVRWIKNWYGNTILYEYFGEDVSDQIPHFTIGNLPEGYVEVERIGTSAAEYVKYQNQYQSSNQIWFNYQYVQQGGASAIVPGDDVIIEITINGMEGEIYIPQNPENKKIIRWIDTKENIHYFITAALEEKALLEMAENIFEKN